MTTIFIATYEHRHGIDNRAFKSEASAWAWRDTIAEEWWEYEFGPDEPRPVEEIGSVYFDRISEESGDESFTVTATELEE